MRAPAARRSSRKRRPVQRPAASPPRPAGKMQQRLDLMAGRLRTLRRDYELLRIASERTDLDLQLLTEQLVHRVVCYYAQHQRLPDDIDLGLAMPEKIARSVLRRAHRRICEQLGRRADGKLLPAFRGSYLAGDEW